MPLLQLLHRCPMQSPDWWKRYGGGLLASPTSIFHAARQERFRDDPPDTMSARFDGSFEPGRSMTPISRLRWEAGYSTEGYLRQWAVADWRFAHPALRAACFRFALAASKQRVPLFFLNPLGDRVEAYHARFLGLLSADEFQVLAWFAHTAGFQPVSDGRFVLEGLVPDLRPVADVPVRHTVTTLGRSC